MGSDYRGKKIVDFKYKGLDCFLAQMGPLPFVEIWWCGYVNIPKTHSFFGKHYDQVNEALDKKSFSVHGGITLSGPIDCKGDAWWIGFDTMHLFSTPEERTEDYARKETERLADFVLQFRNRPEGQEVM